MTINIALYLAIKPNNVKSNTHHATAENVNVGYKNKNVMNTGNSLSFSCLA